MSGRLVDCFRCGQPVRAFEEVYVPDAANALEDILATVGDRERTEYAKYVPFEALDEVARLAREGLHRG